jgi:hypothetical protein
MFETSIITGKVTPENIGAGTTLAKKLYVKIFPGDFSMKEPRSKHKKVLLGELLVKYSAREWPEKKNGPLAGDPGFLKGIKELLKEMNLVNISEVTFAKTQLDIKETITMRVGTKLAQEMLDRGFAQFIDN